MLINLISVHELQLRSINSIIIIIIIMIIINHRDILDSVMARNKSHAVSLKMGRAARFYKRASGLLQGDPLSAALCDIYLGDLVRTKVQYM